MLCGIEFQDGIDDLVRDRLPGENDCHETVQGRVDKDRIAIKVSAMLFRGFRCLHTLFLLGRLREVDRAGPTTRPRDSEWIERYDFEEREQATSRFVPAARRSQHKPARFKVL